MCTAVSVTVKDHYFGRNLDYEHTFGEKVTITPRNYCFEFTNGKKIQNHNAIIGMALPYNGFPLYFDAVNEKGVGIAGLNFPDNAMYRGKIGSKTNIASYELIPWILTQCNTVSDAENLLENINITDDEFNEQIPPTPLHWIISDKEKSVTLEQTVKGIDIYQNPIGVLTNNPTFDMQLFNLNNYINISPVEPENRFSDSIILNAYSKGMGAMGLPGDFSSVSRFIRACFTKLNSVYGETETEILHQFFHILYGVYQPKGCVKTANGFEMTNYSSCCNTDKGIYYYTTYYNSTIRSVDMHKHNLDGDKIMVYDIG